MLRRRPRHWAKLRPQRPAPKPWTTWPNSHRRERPPPQSGSSRARPSSPMNEPDPPICAAGLRRMSSSTSSPRPAPTPDALPLLSTRFDRVSTTSPSQTRQPTPPLSSCSPASAAPPSSRIPTSWPPTPLSRPCAVLAEAEIGRPPDTEESATGSSGAIRPTVRRCSARLAGWRRAIPRPRDGAGSPDPAALRRRADRYRCRSDPPNSRETAAGELVIRAHSTRRGPNKSCIWALEACYSWGADANFVLPRPFPPHLASLCRKLGLAGQVMQPRPGWRGRCRRLLAVPGEASLTRALAQAASSGLPCVASRSAWRKLRPPAWLRIHAGRSQPRAPGRGHPRNHHPRPEALRDFQRRHDPANAARLLCEALALA